MTRDPSHTSSSTPARVSAYESARGSTGGGNVSGAPPPPCQVPHFSPLHVRGGRQRLRRLARHRRRALAVGLAMTAAALAAAGPREPERTRPQGPAAASTARDRGDRDDRDEDRSEERAHGRARRATRLVTAPVRIADAATVRLLRPGDRVDVVAAEAASGTAPRVVASGARVSDLPRSPDGAAEGGALVVLAVPRTTAARLAGASATARLAVTLR
ncbi:hypothetical protein [Streptomyces sp. NPDC059063]|uniref:hypothetical protein n=1 Tax=unclassified Streptomyces TaxID=2593676 RepID=UPI0036BB48B5